MSDRNVSDRTVPDSPELHAVLVIEDTQHDFELVQQFLDRAERENPETFVVERATTLSEGLARLPELNPEVVVVDLHLPDAEGMESVERLIAASVDLAIVVLTSQRDRQRALEALRVGADDYLLKDGLTPELLCRSLLFSIGRAKHRHAERSTTREQQERRAAGQLQANLLPKTTPKVPGYDIAGAYRPADKIGGDLFDILELASGDLLCYVADVSGHSLASALIMAGLRRVVRSLSPRVDDLGELYTAINEAVYEDTDDYQFVTQIILRLEPAARRFTYIGAGHAGFVLRANGDWQRLDSHVPPAGVRERVPDYEPTVVDVRPGDLVVLPTDGFVEAMAPGTQDLWGTGRLESAIREFRDRSAKEIVALVVGKILAYCGPAGPADDCSLVVIKVEET